MLGHWRFHMSQKIELRDVLVLRDDGWLWRKAIPNAVEVREEVLVALRAHPAVAGTDDPAYVGDYRWLCFHGSLDFPGAAWAVVTEAQYEMLKTHPDTVALLPFSLLSVNFFPGQLPISCDDWCALGHVSHTSVIPDGVRWDYWGEDETA